MRRSSNPALNPSLFSQVGVAKGDGAMSIQGTINKIFILLLGILLTASWSWSKVYQAPVVSNTGEFVFAPSGFSIGFASVFGLVAFGLVMITMFNLKWARFTAPAYALCEGAFLGGVSAIFEMQFPGIAIQAMMLTFGTLFAMLSLYKSGLIKVTQKFRLGVSAATGGILIVYILNAVLRFFGNGLPIMYSSSMFGIGFSLFVVGIAALNLVLDFDFIDRAAKNHMPKYMEWYGALGIMVTLVWLYVEILILLAKTRRR